MVYVLHKPEITIILQLYQRNVKFPLPWWKQGSYPVIPIYTYMGEIE